MCHRPTANFLGRNLLGLAKDCYRSLLANLPDDPTGRLHVLSHAWAAATATPMIL
jgi:hypothetical protein